MGSFVSNLHTNLRMINLGMLQIMKNCVGGTDLSASQAMMLVMLLRYGGAVNISQLAEYTHMPKSNVSVIGRRLERAGYVVRQGDAQDMRIVRLVLTQTGKQKAAVLYQKLNLFEEQLEQVATQKEKEMVLQGMTTLNILLKRLEEKECL